MGVEVRRSEVQSIRLDRTDFSKINFQGGFRGEFIMYSPVLGDINISHRLLSLLLIYHTCLQSS